VGDTASRKESPAGILKPPKKFLRETSTQSHEMDLEQGRLALRRAELPTKQRPDARIQQSATYSPVSHCVTRDNAVVFEKKKQRMAKI